MWNICEDEGTPSYSTPLEIIESRLFDDQFYCIKRFCFDFNTVKGCFTWSLHVANARVLSPDNFVSYTTNNIAYYLILKLLNILKILTIYKHFSLNLLQNSLQR